MQTQPSPHNIKYDRRIKKMKYTSMQGKYVKQFWTEKCQNNNYKIPHIGLLSKVNALQ